MKTSNKILIGLITFLGIFCFCFLIYVKSQLIPEGQQEPQETGFIIQSHNDVFGYS